MTIGSGGIHASQRSHRSGRHTSFALASAMALLASGLAAPAAAQADLVVTSGVGDGTVAGQTYGPGDVTVPVGGSVRFEIGSDEPHTVTFGEGPPDVPPPFWPVSGFAEPDPASAPPMDLGSVDYDGTAFVNTGFLFGKGSTATVVFTAAGTFPYFCALHPGMAGQVTAVESGEATTAEEADAARTATAELILGKVEPLREERLAATSTIENEDGTTTHNVFADAATDVEPLPGGGTGYLELLEFTPAAIQIEPGDTIHWTAEKIHTVTFVPEGMDPMELFPSEEALFPPAGGPTYDGTEVAHSGILGFALGPDAPPVMEFALTFPTEGVYPFFCALHAELGQVGVVAVGMPLPEPAG